MVSLYFFHDERSILAAVLLLATLLPRATGQLPRRVERCLPYPTLLTEINEQRQSKPEPVQKVRVAIVEFDSPDGIPRVIRTEISEQLKNAIFEWRESATYLKELAEEIAAVRVTGTLQNNGYFKSHATSELVVSGRSGADIEVAATIRAVPGIQYRTGDIRFEFADDSVPLGISPDVLRELIPLQPGAIFNVERVRTGVENLTRAYQRQGYIDMVSEPLPVVDDARKRIELVVRIDRGVQYHVGDIEFLGLSQESREKMLASLPRRGEVFDNHRLEEAITENRAILPPDASAEEDVRVERNVRAKTVALLFDFRTCPEKPH
jgi:outer membrane translocation and assembly module TamA